MHLFAYLLSMWRRDWRSKGESGRWDHRSDLGERWLWFRPGWYWWKTWEVAGFWMCSDGRADGIYWQIRYSLWKKGRSRGWLPDFRSEQFENWLPFTEMVKIVKQEQLLCEAGRNQELDFGFIKLNLSGEHPDGFLSFFMQCPHLSCSSRLIGIN